MAFRQKKTLHLDNNSNKHDLEFYVSKSTNLLLFFPWPVIVHRVLSAHTPTIFVIIFILPFTVSAITAIWSYATCRQISIYAIAASSSSYSSGKRLGVELDEDSIQIENLYLCTDAK
jgi:spore maturation protein SpmA